MVAALLLALWIGHEFQIHGIEIPYPQKEVRLLAAAGAAAGRG